MGHPVVHFEIGCRERARTQEFFKKLFDWKFEAYGDSALISTGSQSGIQGHITSLGHEPHHYVMIYVQVEDLQACLNKAEILGGKTVVPPTEVSGSGHFAWLADPDANIIGLWKPAAK